MGRFKLISKANPFRARARRAWLAISARSDVHLARFDRRLDVVEACLQINDRVERIAPELRSLLTPMQHRELELMRFGSEFDGGYVLPRELVLQSQGVVSIGVGSNNDVDLELAAAGQVVHAWDHTVSRLPREHPGITFHRVGLGSAVGHNELQSLEHIVDASFGPRATDLVLLLDAEGAEWEAFGNSTLQTLRRFSVVAVEFHDLGNVLVPGNRMLQTLRRLRDEFVPVAVHANNHATYWSVNGFVLPDALEVTYIRTDYLPDAVIPGNCEASLMAPCCPDVDEIYLEWTNHEFPLA